jgi:hypothetical protein
MGRQGSHNKPIGCGASGAYAASPDDEEEEEEEEEEEMGIMGITPRGKVARDKAPLQP